MAPGPSAGWSGRNFSFGRHQNFNRGGAPYRSAPFSHNRAFPGAQQRFTVNPTEGGNRVTADATEHVTVNNNDDGTVSVDIVTAPPAEPEADTEISVEVPAGTQLQRGHASHVPVKR
jgi:hypothetical protein